jgi:O-antigen ligase
MTGFFERLDDLAGITSPGFAAKCLERIAFLFLLLMVVTAPHSIAASQSSWLIGLLATALRFAVSPRPTFKFGALHVALITMFLWAVVSSVFSYEPAISLDKLRSVGLFMVFFFAYLNIRSLRAVKLIVFLLIFSCMFNVVWSLADRAIGHGIQVFGVAPDGPLGKAGVVDGDALLTVNGQKVRSAEDIAKLLDANDTVKITLYRPEEFLTLDVIHADLLSADGATAKLGIAAWETGRNWRAQGFFSHFTTYAEVLQLIASLLFGLIVGAIVRKQFDPPNRADNSVIRVLSSTPVMIVSLAAMLIVMILTVTRASQLAFMVSAFSMILLSGSRKLLLAAAIIAIPVVVGGLLFLQQTRGIGLVDSKDESTQYRMTMWRDGLRLSTTNAHNLVFGLGMDSTKKHWQEWGMFDGGFLPMGHFHSTPMQMLVERGVPALLIWLAVLFLYGLTLWRAVWRQKRDAAGDRWTLAILLGCLGGLIGFFVSGLVHYNIGDGEVAMVFYLLMAVGVRTAEKTGPKNDDETAARELQYKMAA